MEIVILSYRCGSLSNFMQCYAFMVESMDWDGYVEGMKVCAEDNTPSVPPAVFDSASSRGLHYVLMPCFNCPTSKRR